MASSAGVAPAAASPGADITGMFIDGWYPTAYPPNRPISISGQAGEISLVSALSEVRVRGISDTVTDPGLWEVMVDSGSPDVSLALGRMPIVQINGPTTECNVAPDGFADVLELTQAADGSISHFAADVTARCEGGNPTSDVVHAEVRYHSTIDYRAVTIDPMPLSPDGIDFGAIRVGDQSAPRDITVTNSGTLSTAIDVTLPDSPDYVIDGSACSSVVLEPNSSCVMSIVFRPTAVDYRLATISVLTPDLDITAEPIAIIGKGTSPSAISLTAIGAKPIEVAPDGEFWFGISHSPDAAVGTFDIEASCQTNGNGLHGTVGPEDTQPQYYGILLPPGPCRATLDLTGMNGWDSSQAAPIDFVVPSFSTISIDSSTSDGESPGAESRAGLAVTITATVSGTNGVAPTGGTLRIVDVTSGRVLASKVITPGSLSVSGTTGPLAAGLYPFRAEYSGDSTIEGSSTTRTQVVDPAQDTQGPVVGTPAVRLANGNALNSGLVPLAVGWTATDAGSGLASTKLEVSRDGGAWTTVSPASLLSARFGVASCVSVRFRVTATDVLGNTTVGPASAALRTTALDDASSAIRRAGHWASGTLNGAMKGRVAYGTTSGSSMTLTTTARAFGWFAPIGPSLGWAAVYADGRLAARVNLHATGIGRPRLVFVTAWTKTGPHSIRVVVLSGSQTRIATDGFVILR